MYIDHGRSIDRDLQYSEISFGNSIFQAYNVIDYLACINAMCKLQRVEETELLRKLSPVKK